MTDWPSDSTASTGPDIQPGLIPPDLPFEEWDPTECRFVTHEVPGVGGRVKKRVEDFLVDEIPAYEPSGDGEHLHLVIEKRSRTTSDAVRLLSQHFGVPMQDVGYAGLKDKHAISRQAMSLWRADPALADTFEDEGIKIIGVNRHNDKIHRGHLRGNRFVVKIRNVKPHDVLSAQKIINILEREGVPNYFGEQRFGYRHNGQLLGWMLLKEDWQAFLDELLGGHDPRERGRNTEARNAYDDGNYQKALKRWSTVHRHERQAVGTLSRGAPAHDAINAIDESQRVLLVSAFQSALFNYLLNDRIARGLFTELMPGDIAQLHNRRGGFLVRNIESEQHRFDRMEISTTGPMWGPDLEIPASPMGDWERAVLEWTGVTPEELETGVYQPRGSRRAYRMIIRDSQVSGGVDDHGSYIRCAFDLPRGSYATTVLRELMVKNKLPKKHPRPSDDDTQDTQDSHDIQDTHDAQD